MRRWEIHKIDPSQSHRPFASEGRLAGNWRLINVAFHSFLWGFQKAYITLHFIELYISHSCCRISSRGISAWAWQRLWPRPASRTAPSSTRRAASPSPGGSSSPRLTRSPGSRPAFITFPHYSDRHRIFDSWPDSLCLSSLFEIHWLNTKTKSKYCPTLLFFTFLQY